MLARRLHAGIDGNAMLILCKQLHGTKMQQRLKTEKPCITIKTEWHTCKQCAISYTELNATTAHYKEQTQTITALKNEMIGTMRIMKNNTRNK